MNRHVAVAVAVLLIAAGLYPDMASAQQRELPTTTFAALAERGDLKPGRNLLVTVKLHTAAGYQQMKVKLVSLNDAALLVELEEGFSPASTDLNLRLLDGDSALPFKSKAWAVLEIPERRVLRIAGIDSLGNGALIGAAIGAAPVAILAPIAGGCSEYCFLSMAIMAGAGAGIGVGADYARVREGTVYFQAAVSAEPTLTWKPVPMISKERKGFLFVLQW